MARKAEAFVMGTMVSLAVLMLRGIFHTAQAEDCPSARRLFNESISAVSPQEEIRRLRKALKLCRDSEVLGPVWNNLADAHARLGRISEALTFYRRAVEAQPHLAVAYVGAGDLYALLGDAYSAQILYDKGCRYGYPEEKLRDRRDWAAESWPWDLVVYFKKGRAALNDSARERLDLLMERLRSMNEPFSLVIEGFSCDLGPEADNTRLARQRAHAVAQHLRRELQEKTVFVCVHAWGEEKPAVNAFDEAARILNRRVRIRILSGRIPESKGPWDGRKFFCEKRPARPSIVSKRR